MYFWYFWYSWFFGNTLVIIIIIDNPYKKFPNYPGASHGVRQEMRMCHIYIYIYIYMRAPLTKNHDIHWPGNTCMCVRVIKSFNCVNFASARSAPRLSCCGIPTPLRKAQWGGRTPYCAFNIVLLLQMHN